MKLVGVGRRERKVSPFRAPQVALGVLTLLLLHPAARAQCLGFTEEFSNVAGLKEWTAQNNSDAVGATSWFQGTAVFPAYSGDLDEYVGANYQATDGSTISLWLISPEITFQPTDRLSFWTRTATGSTFPDRLQVRLSLAGASVDVGGTPTSVGDFAILLLEINSTLVQGGYPEVWTRYELAFGQAEGSGRAAFRYFVTNAGPTGDNSNIIAIDRAAFDVCGRIFENGFESGDSTGWSDSSLLMEGAETPRSSFVPGG